MGKNNSANQTTINLTVNRAFFGKSDKREMKIRNCLSSLSGLLEQSSKFSDFFFNLNSIYLLKINFRIPVHSFTCVGVLWRTRNITIVAIIIQWDANKWTGILEFSLYLCHDGSKIISERPGLPRHIAPSFVHCSEFSSEVTSGVIDKEGTLPLGFRCDEGGYHHLEGKSKPFGVAYNQEKPNLVKTHASDPFQHLIHS